MTNDDAVTPARDSERDDQRMHDRVGAYALDALPVAERAAFEAHLRECAQCQSALQEYGPIATLLPRLYDDLDLPAESVEIDPRAGVSDETADEATALDVEQESASTATRAPTIAGVDRAVEAMVPELQDPILPDIASPAVATEEAAAETAAITAEFEDTTAEPVQTRRRPRGRIAPGEAPPEASLVTLPRERRSIVPWAVAAAAVILAIGVILWALAMMGQIDDLKTERDVQDQQIVQMEQERQHYLAQTPALVHPLIATTASSGDAAGMVYLDPDPAGQGGVVTFQGMAQPPSGQVYQVWTITNGTVAAGPTFTPDADGRAIVQVGNQAATADQMVITLEPTGGSETPTTDPIMQGVLRS
ncbi:MAG: anti-sigma factor [Thermomicrobiales bacterium]|nr:anti-sigma factor [Thermomicrobiales bacterium]